MDKSRSASGGPPRALGYLRVSTEDQALSGAGLEAQRAAIVAEVARRGWVLVEMVEDAGFSAKSLDRPGIQRALPMLEGRGRVADVLVVAKLDRLSRSVHDAAGLLTRSQRRGWSLVALDVAVDTSTPSGEAMAGMMAVFAQLERRMIGERTRSALAVKRAQGVRLGRRRLLPDAVLQGIVDQHEAGVALAAIARELNARGTPTAHGGAQWHASTVRAVIRSQDGLRMAAAG